jgi:hypothetical protein
MNGLPVVCNFVLRVYGHTYDAKSVDALEDDISDVRQCMLERHPEACAF